jgi:hypothetical protein
MSSLRVFSVLRLSLFHIRVFLRLCIHSSLSRQLWQEKYRVVPLDVYVI